MLLDKPALFSIPFATAFAGVKKDKKNETFDGLFFSMIHAKTVIERRVIAETLVRILARRKKDPLFNHPTYAPQVEISGRGDAIDEVYVELDHGDPFHWFEAKWLDPDRWKDTVDIDEYIGDMSVFQRKIQRFIWTFAYAGWSGVSPVSLEWGDPGEEFDEESLHEQEHFSHVLLKFRALSFWKPYEVVVNRESGWVSYTKEVTRYVDGMYVFYKRTLESPP